MRFRYVEYVADLLARGMPRMATLRLKRITMNRVLFFLSRFLRFSQNIYLYFYSFLIYVRCLIYFWAREKDRGLLP
jgi:hypothetical protein